VKRPVTKATGLTDRLDRVLFYATRVHGGQVHGGKAYRQIRATSSIRAPHNRKPGEQQQEKEPMAIGTKPAFTAMANRHPADELADIRDQIAVLKTRETKLRNALLNAEQSDRIGEEWIAEITQWKSNRLDNAALKKHFGLEALQPFMRESVTNSIKLISIQTGKRRLHRSEETPLGGPLLQA
jgi:hypothetical protein